jgi:hypothetical protein
MDWYMAYGERHGGDGAETGARRQPQ